MLVQFKFLFQIRFATEFSPNYTYSQNQIRLLIRLLTKIDIHRNITEFDSVLEWNSVVIRLLIRWPNLSRLLFCPPLVHFVAWENLDLWFSLFWRTNLIMRITLEFDSKKNMKITYSCWPNVHEEKSYHVCLEAAL